MANQKHLIRKLSFEFTLSDKEQAGSLQQRVDGLIRERILPKLDEIFSQLSHSDTVSRIERLEIDLGILPLANWERELPGKVVTAIRREISRQSNQPHEECLSARKNPLMPFRDTLSFQDIPGNQNPVAPTCAQAGTFRSSDEAPPLPFAPQEGGGDEDAPSEAIIRGSATSRSTAHPKQRVIPEKVFTLELLGYFLKTGIFPWWAGDKSFNDLERAFSGILESAPFEVQLFMEKELPDERTRHRLIYQFPDAMLLRLIELRAPGKKDHVRAWLSDFKEIWRKAREINLTAHPDAQSKVRLLIWDVILTVVFIRHWQELEEDKIYQIILSSLAARHEEAYTRLIFHLHNAGDRLSQSPGTFRSALAQVVAKLSDEIARSSMDLENQEIGQLAIEGEQPGIESGSGSSARAKGEGQEQHLPPASEERTVPVPGRGSQPPSTARSGLPAPFGGIQPGLKERRKDKGAGKPGETESNQTEDEAMTSPLYIENAGLILAWPHLGTFFQHLGLVQDGKFTDETSAVRAIHLLQLLVTGKDEGEAEYLLPLNKLLCGWDIRKPVTRDFQASDLEKSEAEELLKTIISQWPVLKNTSIQGLRVSFLQRTGALVHRGEKGWLLQIERKAYDLLLDRLPWGISIVKLSWMATTLFVEWQG